MPGRRCRTDQRPVGITSSAELGGLYPARRFISRLDEFCNLLVIELAKLVERGAVVGGFTEAALERVRVARTRLDAALEADDAYEVAMAEDELEDALRLARSTASGRPAGGWAGHRGVEREGRRPAGVLLYLRHTPVRGINLAAVPCGPARQQVSAATLELIKRTALPCTLHPAWRDDWLL